MPTGTPYHSYIPPYRIRVDDFATPSTTDTTPLLHLLTHTHSDHINGLSAKSFGYKVYCSHDAKEMLLRHEVYKERQLHADDLRAEKCRTYSHLKVDPQIQADGTLYYRGSRDLLHALPIHTPTEIELSGNEKVTITLLDANHCPGAVMFLIEGSKGAILHTGDFRAEPWFLESIARNPYLQRYLAPSHTQVPGSLPSTISSTLEAIYLDTACVFTSLRPPSKQEAVSGLVDLMKLYPTSAYFFLNIWTWGYEDILKKIAREFQAPVHVDRYKHSIYQNLNDPVLRSLATADPSLTRFHACERFDRCSYVAVDQLPGSGSFTHSTSRKGNWVVYVNPVTMGEDDWKRYHRETASALRKGQRINNLLVPLLRHSTLPELQDFVQLFQPKRVVPNTLEPRLGGLDWMCIDRLFASHLHPSSRNTVLNAITPNPTLQAIDLEDGDSALKNLVGEGAEDLARYWAEGAKLREKLAFISSRLDEDHRRLIRALLPASDDPPNLRNSVERERKSAPSNKEATSRTRRYDDDSDEDTIGSDDDRGRTAHILFAAQAGIDVEGREHGFWFSSQPSVDDESVAGPSEDVLAPLHTGPTPVSPSKIPLLPGPSNSRHKRPFTPPSSPPLSKRVDSPERARHVGQRRILSPPILSSPHSPGSSPISHKGARVLQLDQPQSNVSPSFKPPLQRRSPTGTALSSGPLSNRPLISPSIKARSPPTLETSPLARILPPPLSTPESSVPAVVHSRHSDKKRKAMDSSPNHSDDARPTKKANVPLSSDTPHLTRHPVGAPKPARKKHLGEDELLAVFERAYRRRPRSLKPDEVDQLEHLRYDPDLSVEEKAYLMAWDNCFAMERNDRSGGDKTRYVERRAALMLALQRETRKRLSEGEVVLETPALQTQQSGYKSTAPPAVAKEATMVSLEPVFDGDEDKVDWNRSKQLEEQFKQDVAEGRKPNIPTLKCTRESQSTCAQPAVE